MKVPFFTTKASLPPPKKDLCTGWRNILHANQVSFGNDYFEILDTLRHVSFRGRNYTEALVKHRNFILRSGLDFNRKVGVEIGPLCSPIVSKSEGEVLYVDHLDADGLASKYRSCSDVDPAKIAHVDLVWGDSSLKDLLNGKQVDYVFASHVAEHVPNLIAWLMEVHDILKETGQLRVVLPDMRFSFDALRRETDPVSLLVPYLAGARQTQLREILDHYLHRADNMDGWARFEGLLDMNTVRPAHSYAEAVREAQCFLDRKNYVDIHSWAFTPKGFAENMAFLAKNDLLKMACADFTDSAYPTLEFYVFFRPELDKAKAVDSWCRMAAACKDIPR